MFNLPTKTARLKLSSAVLFCVSGFIIATNIVATANDKVSIAKKAFLVKQVSIAEQVAIAKKTLLAKRAAPDSRLTFHSSFFSSHAWHKFYVSLAQVEYNAETKSLEIAIRVFPDDLELALKRANNRNVDLARTPDVDKLLLAYLQTHFEIQNAKGETQILQWVGKETEVDSTWLYLESPCPGGLTDARARNTLFFELYPEQANTINFKQAARKNDLTWRRSSSSGGGDWQKVFEAK